METKKKLFDYKIEYLHLLTIIFGFVGFLIENTTKTISDGYIDSRYQRLPCIWGYGLVILIIYYACGTPDNMRFFRKPIRNENKEKGPRHFLYFLLVTLFIFLAEWSAGEIFELLTGSILWDYSNVPLHIGKYVCVPFSIGFGLGAYVFMAFVFDPFMKYMETHIPHKAVCIIDIVIGIPVIIDFIITTVILAMGNAPRIIWTIYWPWFHK